MELDKETMARLERLLQSAEDNISGISTRYHMLAMGLSAATWAKPELETQALINLLKKKLVRNLRRAADDVEKIFKDHSEEKEDGPNLHVVKDESKP